MNTDRRLNSSQNWRIKRGKDITDGNYSLFLDDNNTVNDTVPLARSGTVRWSGTITGGKPSSTLKFCFMPSCPTATVTTSGPTSFTTGGSVVLTASESAGQTYQWNKDGTVITGATSYTYSASQRGSYTVTITREGCSVTSQPTTIDIILATESLIPGFSLKTYPSPTERTATMEVENVKNQTIQVRLLNASGQILQSWEIKPHVKQQLHQIDLPNAGLYILQAFREHRTGRSQGMIQKKILRK